MKVLNERNNAAPVNRSGTEIGNELDIAR